MTIKGVVESVVFQNSDSGFTVAKVLCDTRLLTVVGRLTSLFEGQIIEATGSIVQNEKFGEQFQVENYTLSQPATEVGIVKYLSSGLIRGVGPVTARNIVEKFGKETLDIIELNPLKLTEVHGVTPKKATEIGNAFLELKKMQDVIMFLQQYDNISTNMCIKIFNKYGDHTKEIMQKNPYKLVEDIDRVGFKTADKIALTVGIERDSEYRIRAGLVYVLKQSSERDGNTFLPVSIAEKELEKLLGLSIKNNQAFESVINQMLLESVIKRCVFDDVECLMLVRYFNVEFKIATKLTLLNEKSEIEQDLSSEIESFERFHKVKFHANQKRAIEIAINNGVSVITGGPGTGKTTIIKCILQILKNRNSRTALLAPTGRAAKRMSESCGEEASTIHRALMVGYKGDDSLSDEGYFYYNETNRYPFDAIIVDEMSMVDVNLMLSLLNALDRGTKLILVGDINQLPSVGAGNVLADIIRSEKIKCAQLTHIYRQSESSLIITNAHAINAGVMPTIDNKCKDFFFESKETPEDIANCVTQLVCGRISRFLDISPLKIQVLAPMRAGTCGIDNLNTILQEKLNPPAPNKKEYKLDKVVFRVGDKVMQTANNYSQVWRKPRANGSFEIGEAVFNGDIGFVTNIFRETDSVEVTFEDGRITEYSREDAKQMMLSYAITIHKSQGSEFDVVVIPIIAGASSILTRNLLYTAVTRAKQMVVLVGSRKNLHIMVGNNYTAKRYSALSIFLNQISNRRGIGE